VAIWRVLHQPCFRVIDGLAWFAVCSFLATAVKASPSGKYVYAADVVNGVRAFSLNAMSGALTEIAGSPFPAAMSLSESLWIRQESSSIPQFREQQRFRVYR